MRILQTLIILAALAFLGYAVWQNISGGQTVGPAHAGGGETTAPPGPSSGGGVPTSPQPGLSQQPGVCARCGGTGFVTCAACEGKGTVTRVELVKCDQCNGTGRYKARVGAGNVPCPFCKGTGHIEKTVTAQCSICGGTGKVPCPVCRAPKSVERRRRRTQ